MNQAALTIPIEIVSGIGLFALASVVSLLVWVVRNLQKHQVVVGELTKSIEDLQKDFSKLPCGVHDKYLNNQFTADKLVKQRLDMLDNNFTEHKANMSDIEGRLDDLKSDFKDLKYSVETVSTNMQGLSDSVKHLHNEFKDLIIELGALRAASNHLPKQKYDKPTKTKNS